MKTYTITKRFSYILPLIGNKCRWFCTYYKVYTKSPTPISDRKEYIFSNGLECIKFGISCFLVRLWVGACLHLVCCFLFDLTVWGFFFRSICICFGRFDFIYIATISVIVDCFEDSHEIILFATFPWLLAPYAYMYLVDEKAVKTQRPRPRQGCVLICCYKAYANGQQG
jgi:hypothetical protein